MQMNDTTLHFSDPSVYFTIDGKQKYKHQVLAMNLEDSVMFGLCLTLENPELFARTTETSTMIPQKKENCLY